MRTLWYLPLFALMLALPACKNCCRKDCRRPKTVAVAQSNAENRAPETLANAQERKPNKEDYTSVRA